MVNRILLYWLSVGEGPIYIDGQWVNEKNVIILRFIGKSSPPIGDQWKELHAAKKVICVSGYLPRRDAPLVPSPVILIQK